MSPVHIAVHVRALMNDKGHIVEPERRETVRLLADAKRVAYFTQSTCNVLSFERKERLTFDLEERTYRRRPLHVLAASRSLELANREHICAVLTAGGVADNDFQRVLIEHQLAAMTRASKTRLGARSFFGGLVGSKPDIEPTQTKGQTRFVALGRTLLTTSSEAIEAPVAPLVHFVRAQFGCHPLLLKHLLESGTLPRSLVLGALMPTFTGGEVTLQIQVSSEASPSFPRVSDFTETPPGGSEPIDVILQGTAWKTPGAPVGVRLAESLALLRGSEPIAGLLAFFELTLELGVAMPPDFAAELNKCSDLQVQRLLALLSNQLPPEDAAKCFDILRPHAGERSYLLGAFEAPVRLALNQPEKAFQLLVELLSHNPRVTGAYKDLGDIFQTSFDSERAWACWNRARQIAPEFSTLKDISAFEQHLETEHPEYFGLQISDALRPSASVNDWHGGASSLRSARRLRRRRSERQPSLAAARAGEDREPVRRALVNHARGRQGAALRAVRSGCVPTIVAHAQRGRGAAAEAPGRAAVRAASQACGRHRHHGRLPGRRSSEASVARAVGARRRRADEPRGAPRVPAASSERDRAGACADRCRERGASDPVGHPRDHAASGLGSGRSASRRAGLADRHDHACDPGSSEGSGASQKRAVLRTWGWHVRVLKSSPFGLPGRRGLALGLRASDASDARPLAHAPGEFLRLPP